MKNHSSMKIAVMILLCGVLVLGGTLLGKALLSDPQAKDIPVSQSVVQ